MTLSALAVLILIPTAQLSANELPNDCAIVATEANARLATSAVWTRVLLIRAIDLKKFGVLSHVLVVWQMHKDGVILVYDAGGTLPLTTHSQDAREIAIEINKTNPSQPIFEARFIE